MTTVSPHAYTPPVVLATHETHNGQMTYAHYDRSAPWYVLHLQDGHPLDQSVPAAHRAIIPAMLAALPPGCKHLPILDICCGTGIFTRALAMAGAQHLIGIDLARQLLAHAQDEEHAVLAQHRARITYLIDDVMHLATQQPASAHVITCCLGVTDVADLPAFYRSVMRVLQPGGRTILSLIHPAAPCSAPDGDLEFLPVAYHEESTYTTRNPKSVRGRVPTYHRPLSRYLSHAKAAGLHLEDLIECPASPEVMAQQPRYRSVPYGLVLVFTKAEEEVEQ